MDRNDVGTAKSVLVYHGHSERPTSIRPAVAGNVRLERVDRVVKVALGN